VFLTLTQQFLCMEEDDEVSDNTMEAVLNFLHVLGLQLSHENKEVRQRWIRLIIAQELWRLTTFIVRDKVIPTDDNEDGTAVKNVGENPFEEPRCFVELVSKVAKLVQFFLLDDEDSKRRQDFAQKQAAYSAMSCSLYARSPLSRRPQNGLKV
jgi:hypothetical protein